MPLWCGMDLPMEKIVFFREIGMTQIHEHMFDFAITSNGRQYYYTERYLKDTEFKKLKWNILTTLNKEML